MNTEPETVLKNVQCVHPDTGTFRFRGNHDRFLVNKGIFASYLKQKAAQLGLTQARMCFHEGDASLLQLMLVYHSTFHRVRRHLHPDKDEYLQIISGAMTVRFYGIENSVTHIFRLSNNGDPDVTGFLCFVKKGTIHDVKIDEDACFLEITTGPFHKNSTLNVLD